MKPAVKYFFALTAILLYSVIINAQQKFISGYIIKSNNDTLKGFLKEDLEKNLINQITFSNSANGNEPQVFTCNTAKAFYFTNGNLFESISIADTTNTTIQRFVKVLLKGYDNLYTYRTDDAQYFVVKNNESTYLLFDDLLTVNGLLDTKGNFRNQLLFLSHNCSKLQSTVTSVRYNEGELLNFIKKLNNCLAPGSLNSSLYVKEKSETHFFVFAGGLPLGEKYEYAARIGARISLPSISRNTSVNLAASYLGEKTQETLYGKQKDHITNVASIGVSLQNNFTTGIIQPYLEAGVGAAYKNEKDPAQPVTLNGFQHKYGVDIFAALGIEGYITKRLAIKADWRYELLLHYPVVGIVYFFPTK